MKQILHICLIGLFAALAAAVIAGWIVTQNPAPSAAAVPIEGDLIVKFG